jgi:hypothetical protein
MTGQLARGTIGDFKEDRDTILKNPRSNEKLQDMINEISTQNIKSIQLKNEDFLPKMYDLVNQMPMSDDKQLVERWNDLGPLELDSIISHSRYAE